MLAPECQLGSVAAEQDVEVMAPVIGFILSEAAAGSLIPENQQDTRLLYWERMRHFVAFLHSRCCIHQVRWRFHRAFECPRHYYQDICSFLANRLTMIGRQPVLQEHLLAPGSTSSAAECVHVWVVGMDKCDHAFRLERKGEKGIKEKWRERRCAFWTLLSLLMCEHAPRFPFPLSFSPQSLMGSSINVAVCEVRMSPQGRIEEAMAP